MDTIITMIVVLVFVSIGSVFTFQILSSGAKRVPTGPSNFQFKCPAGQCATDIKTGFKICPSNNTDQLEIDPAQSVCNSKYLCENPLTPYAMNYDQSTSFSGVCPAGVECPCLQRTQCPEYVTAVFQANNGNPYGTIDGQRLSFTQLASYSSATGISINQPFVLDAPGGQFCFAPISWLPLSNPGCPMFSDRPTYQQLVDCMGGALGCSGLNGNPCAQGTLAVIANSVDEVDILQLPTSIVGCVRGNPCPCGQLAVFDKQFGNVVCRQYS